MRRYKNDRKSLVVTIGVTVLLLISAIPILAQDAAPSSHLVYNDNFQSDIIINEVRVPADGEATYTYYETLGWFGVLGGYAGIQAHPNGHVFIFSVWDNNAHTGVLESAYALPGTQVSGFGGEGTGMKNMNFELGWSTDTWYVFVVRSWDVGNRTHVGCWVQKGDNDQWYHIATVDVAVDNAYLGGRTDSFLEDWLDTGENKRTIHLRKGWKRKPDLSWHASTMGYYSVNQWDLDPGGRSYNYRTNWDGGTDSDHTGMFYYMTSGGAETSPTTTNGSWHSIPRNETSHGFATIDVQQLTGQLINPDDLRLRWNHDRTTSPQFSYTVEVYDNAQGTGTPLLTETATMPQAREHLLDVSSLDTAGSSYYAFLSVADVFGQVSSPISLEFGMGTTPDYITVTAPDGGEALSAAGSADIMWESNLNGLFDIYLMKGDVELLQIAAGVNATSYQWDIPAGIPAADDYAIRIQSGSATDDSNSDFSISGFDSAHVPLSTANLSVYSYDSQQSGNEATNVLDNDASTIWHTRWSPTTDSYPHEIVLKADKAYVISGLSYLAREGAGNGTIKDYEIYVSMDALNWGSAVASGSFDAATTTQKVFFSTKEGQYVKLVALSEQNGNPWASAAEIRILHQLQPQSHTITATSSVGGALTPSGNVSVPEGYYKIFSIMADMGYNIADVEVDGVSIGPTESYIFPNVTADHTIHAIFTPGIAPTVEAIGDETVTLQEGGGGGGDPVAGAYFEWDATQDTEGNSTWSSTTANVYDWTFDAGNLSPVAISDARFNRLSHAYVFPTAKDGSNTSWQSFGSGSAASFEFVIDVDGTDGSVFETGASNGLQVDIANGVLRGAVGQSSGAKATYALTQEDMGRFIHVVFIADPANQVIQLYVDGQLKDSKAWANNYNWSGSNAAALGSHSGKVVDGGTKADFTGKIGLFRFYRDKALSATEVSANFNALSYGYGAVAQLDGIINDSDSESHTSNWSLVSTNPPGMSVIIEDATSVSTTATFVEPGTYILRLTASDGYYQGTGDIEITVNPLGSISYHTWVTTGSFANPLTDTALSGNQDEDWRTNLMEFAFGTDPTLMDYGSLAVDGSRHGDPIIHKTSDGEMVISFIRRKDHASAGIIYTVCFSSDLTSFQDNNDSTNPPAEIIDSLLDATNYEVVRVPYPAGTRFGYVRVEATP